MENLKSARSSLGYSQQKLASLIGVSRSTVAMWETGASQPDNDSIIRLSRLLNVSTDYLLGTSDDTSHPSSSGVKIPVLGDVRAGLPIEAVENIIDYEEISTEMARSGEYFALRVVGDSMEPRICEGDVVIVRKQPDLESGEVGIVLVNGDSATVKKVVKHADGISLIAYNAACYPPHFYTKKEIATLPVTIIGKVVELRAKF